MPNGTHDMTTGDFAYSDVRDLKVAHLDLKHKHENLSVANHNLLERVLVLEEHIKRIDANFIGLIGRL